MDKTHGNKKVLVTGAGGSIGSELCRQIILEAPSQIFIVDHSEPAIFRTLHDLNSRNEGGHVEIIPVLINCASPEFVDLFAGNEIDFIYHAAAYKHVTLSEMNPSTYYRNNIMSTFYCQKIAIRSSAKFALVSTDKAVHPSNTMGKSKRLCEMLALAHASLEGAQDKTSIVRFGNVLNSSGSVIPIFMAQIQRGGPVTVTDPDAKRFFMSATEATSLVLSSARIRREQCILALDMGPAIKIHSLACNLIEQAGYHVTYFDQRDGEIKIEFTGLRPGEKKVEEISYGPLTATDIERIKFANEWTNFGEAELSLCLEYGKEICRELPVEFSWESGFAART